jgi:hypothetical protein
MREAANRDCGAAQVRAEEAEEAHAVQEAHSDMLAALLAEATQARAAADARAQQARTEADARVEAAAADIRRSMGYRVATALTRVRALKGRLAEERAAHQRRVAQLERALAEERAAHRRERDELERTRAAREEEHACQLEVIEIGLQNNRALVGRLRAGETAEQAVGWVLGTSATAPPPARQQ